VNVSQLRLRCEKFDDDDDDDNNNNNNNNNNLATTLMVVDMDFGSNQGQGTFLFSSAFPPATYPMGTGDKGTGAWKHFPIMPIL
jgi:hypothetical protein